MTQTVKSPTMSSVNLHAFKKNLSARISNNQSRDNHHAQRMIRKSLRMKRATFSSSMREKLRLRNSDRRMSGPSVNQTRTSTQGKRVRLQKRMTT